MNFDPTTHCLRGGKLMRKPTGRPSKADVDYVEQDCGYETPCWIWQRSTVLGYGCLRIARKTFLAHRIYYERYVGPIPEGLDLDHLCRNRACVNPEHLEPVTRAENLRRGKQTKLTREAVLAIRLRHTSGVVTQRELANEYRVSPQTISSILNYYTWKDSM